MWEDSEGNLCFGDEKGDICKFIHGVYHDYSESGNKAIVAYWTIPDMDGNLFWRNKTIRVAAIQAAPFPQNKLRLEYKKNGVWTVLKEWGSKLGFFQWSALSWGGFTWYANAEHKTVTTKITIKKVDKAGFRVVCDEIDKAFGLYAFSLEYAEKGRYKK